MPTTFTPDFVASFDSASPFAGFAVGSVTTNDGRHNKGAICGTLEAAVPDGENVTWGFAIKLESGNFSSDIRVISTTNGGPNLLLEQIGDGRLLVRFQSDVVPGTATLGAIEDWVFNTVDWFYIEVITTLTSSVITALGISTVTLTVTVDIRVNNLPVFTGGDTYVDTFTAGSEPPLVYDRVALRNTGQGYYTDDWYIDTTNVYGDGDAQSNDTDFIIQDADAELTQAFLEASGNNDNEAYLTQAFLEPHIQKDNDAYLTQAFLETGLTKDNTAYLTQCFLEVFCNPAALGNVYFANTGSGPYCPVL